MTPVRLLCVLALTLTVGIPPAVETQEEPLRSWNDGTSKRTIIQFVEAVTRVVSPDFVPIAERIAVFGNDGTPVFAFER